MSIVVPCQNERKFIGKCLDSIIAQNYPKDRIELLVVDGMSEDGTKTIVEEYASQHPFIHFVNNPQRITPCAINIGIRGSKGDIIVIMSAHSEFHPNYINDGVEVLNQTGADVAGGPVITMPGANTLIAKSIALATSHPFGVGNSKFRTCKTEEYVDTVPFGVYRREIFQRVGLFDERLERNQDNELSSRIIKLGGKIYSTPKLISSYYNQATLAGLLKQAAKTGMWNVATVLTNPSAFRLRHFIPFAFVSALITLSFISLLRSWGKVVLLCLIIIYCIAAMMSIIVIWKRQRSMGVIFLPLVFPAYHITYGLGTWKGLFRLIYYHQAKSDKTEV